jgi:hypothetical protein
MRLNFFLSILFVLQIGAHDALVIVPVADLVDAGQAISIGKNNKKAPTQVLAYYEDGSKSPRVGQLLFNEVVTVLEKHGELVRVFVQNQAYKAAKSSKLLQEFWTTASSLCPLNEVNRSTVPLDNTQVVTLKDPFVVPKTALTLSVGTRLRMLKEREHEVDVLIYNHRRRSTVTVTIPKRYIINVFSTPRERAVELARYIAHAPGKTPYVWGGSSCVHQYEPLRYAMAHVGSKKGKAYVVDGEPIPSIYTGCDCSGFIMRVMQAAGIPLTAKNSLTMKEVLGTLSSDVLPQNGDIIYMPGHVVLITDVECGLVTEARTQDHGYGYIQEVHIGELFEGVDSLYQLHEQANTPQRRLNKQRECIGTMKVVILPLAGCYGEFDSVDMRV